MLTRRMLTILAAVALPFAAPLAQVAAQGPAGQMQPPSSKGVVIKGKAPVSNEILKITLPRPQEADLPGAAAMTAAMMVEGTTTRDTQQIAREQETMASTVSLSTSLSSQTASMLLNSLADNLDRTLDLAADILLNPVFPEQEFARYKTRQKASLLQLRSNPSFLAQERFYRVIYGDHPASRII